MNFHFFKKISNFLKIIFGLFFILTKSFQVSLSAKKTFIMNDNVFTV